MSLNFMADARPNSPSPFALKLDLWWQFTVRAVEMRHRGSYLGVFWTVLNPLLMLGLYVIIFGYIFKSKFHAGSNESSVDYALAVFLGLIVFHLVAETIAASPTYIITSPNLVKKVVFPLETLPLANTSSLWFHAFVSFCLLLLACLLTGRGLSFIGLLWMPAILAPLAMITVGLSWFLSALGVFFRDISQVVGFTAQVTLYISGVFIPVSTMMKAPVLWSILKWNPLLHIIELARNALLWNQPIDFRHLLYIWIAGAAVLLAGKWFFKKWQPAFADVL